MSERICSIDGCDLVTGVPGTARGFCSKHYNRWRRWGDPLLLAPRSAKPTVCEVTGCDRPAKTRGYCVAHYSNLLRHGEPTPRKRGEVRDGKKVCPRCEVDLPLSSFTLGSGYVLSPCIPCEWARTADWRAANPERMRKYALDWQKRHPDKVRDRQARRRARKNGADGQVDRVQIYSRDGWICQMCLSPIDPTVPWPEPMSPSVDHIVPLVHGGAHHPDNCQASHLRCNMAKGARVVGLLAAANQGHGGNA